MSASSPVTMEIDDHDGCDRTLGEIDDSAQDTPVRRQRGRPSTRRGHCERLRPTTLFIDSDNETMEIDDSSPGLDSTLGK